MKEKTYLVVYLTETDGDVLITRMTAKEIREGIENGKLGTLNDFAVIEGDLIKSMDSKNMSRVK